MKDKGIKAKEILKQHIFNNKKEYIIVTLFFVIGIFAGVFFINNVQELPKQEITSYMGDFIEKLKQTENLDSFNLLKTSIIQNIVLGVALWFFGTTVIRNTNSIWYIIL